MVISNNKAVLITGCDTGFGFHTAKRLSEKGFQVFAGCLSPLQNEGQNLSTYPNIHCLKMDVSLEQDIESVLNYVKENLEDKELWAIINNAGISKGSEIEMTTIQKMEEVIDVNLLGTIRVTKAFLPLLRKSKGRVINVASAAGRLTMPGFVTYSASKQAIIAFSDGLRLEMQKFGVSVITIEPWMFRTRLSDPTGVSRHIEKQWTEAEDDIRTAYTAAYATQIQKSTKGLFAWVMDSNICKVIDAMEAAVTSECPPYHYRPGRCTDPDDFGQNQSSSPKSSDSETKIMPSNKHRCSGCDSGFGHDLAQRLDDLGLQVFAGCLNPEGEGAKNLKKSASAKLQVLPLDVSSEESVDKFHKQVVQKIKDNKLWAVVCNAGMNDGAEIFWTNTDIIQRVIDVNTFGVVRVTKAFLPQLCKSKGRVVTVCSAASLYTYAGMVPYCMSKHAAKSFCDGLRLELYRFGVKVVTIDPWMYKTNITKEDFTVKYITKTWEQAPAEIKEFYPEEYFQRYKKVIIRFLNYAISDKPQQVIDCLEEAVMALSPKYSYNPGTVYSRLSFWLIRRLPKQLADFILHEEFATKC
ncbi:D-beta-hydroxybutyrate dehydrogenase like protein [Argiope bruennichi]|uniref:D-beta-hydroxybutyrate dehydrogenase like protein n=1 Tax=Argiope bruennichi TaxID=94029 RepID=A0A8T0FWP7_ARGBR|nr:D-beta-hydroxybutyrate dehydrogenase like protein [Argiope bruennichi]